MPLPFIIGGVALVAGLVGAKSGINGALKMKEANETIENSKNRHNKNIRKFEELNKEVMKLMDDLGKKELRILNSFERFSNVFEKIKNKPQFKSYNKGNINIPEYNAQELKDVSMTAGVLLGGLGGAAFGTAAGFAAAGVTTTAVMALGTASTGTVIASLSGAAATNATLAAIGGGALAAGGGGMALGATILGGATLGVGLLVGGVIFNMVGSSLTDKADEAYKQMREIEDKINGISSFLNTLKEIIVRFDEIISKVNKIYINHFNSLVNIVERSNKTDWNLFTDEEKLVTENTVLLVSLLYNMGKVRLILVSDDKTKANEINTSEINETIENAEEFLEEKKIKKETVFKL